jgi:hypothetical protein
MAPTKPKASQSNQRLKAVVRRLPPDLPPAVFWKTVEPWIHRENTADKQDTTESKENTVAWSDYKQGVVRKRSVSAIHSRSGQGGADSRTLRSLQRQRQGLGSFKSVHHIPNSRSSRCFPSGVRRMVFQGQNWFVFPSSSDAHPSLNLSLARR